MRESLKTYEVPTQITLHIPQNVDRADVLDIIRDAMDEYNHAMASIGGDLDTNHRVAVPERPFLVEIGAITVVVYISLGGAAGLGALYILRKAVDALAD